MLSEILSIVGLGNSYISGIKMGKKIDQIIDQSKKLNSTIERIAEHLFYAPDVEEVYSSRQEKISDYRLIRENLEPIQQVFNHDLLSTAMVTTSQKLKEAFNKDPFEVLDFIRPITRSKEHPNPDMVPIIFEDSNIRYVGWIMKGLLPVVFGFEYYNKSNLHLPSKAVVNLNDLRQAEEKKYPIIFNSGARRELERLRSKKNDLSKNELLHGINQIVSWKPITTKTHGNIEQKRLVFIKDLLTKKINFAPINEVYYRNSTNQEFLIEFENEMIEFLALETKHNK